MTTLEIETGTCRPAAFRRGELYRYRDPSGVSGVGVVAQVVMFSNGWVAVAWLGDNPCVTLWPSLESLLMVHGHGGATEVRWLDDAPEESTAETSQCHQLPTQYRTSATGQTGGGSRVP
ncbi:hypothetical protein OG474_29850 [Kribbella sp. NBC_01505]|uniref:hypothetical protein n=1 Tax=Kribbella sp. NBC_01505 TaxID=2903580 RepID=UPI0038664289